MPSRRARFGGLSRFVEWKLGSPRIVVRAMVKIGTSSITVCSRPLFCIAVVVRVGETAEKSTTATR